MHQIILVPNNSTANAALFYRTREKADLAYQNIHEMMRGSKEATVLTERDDFGVLLAIPIANVSYAILGDIAKQNELRVLQEGLKK